jgi:hypothetical protein
MTARNYSSIAPLMTLAGGIVSGSTTMTVDTVAGLPGAFPYTVVIDAGLAGEEIVTVTNSASLTLTITRGQDGTTATSHSAGAPIRHMATARDYAEPQAHINASAAVHGLAGTVVGTTDAQTLTNKVISGASNTLSNIASASITGLDGSKITGANTVAKAQLPTDVVYLATAQTLTNKVITAPTGIVKADVGLGNVDNTSDTTKNAAAVTLTNKTISGSANTLTNIPNSALSTGIDAGKVASVAASFVPKAALPTDTVYNTDTGSLTGGSAFNTFNSGWTNNGSTARVKNGVAMIQLKAIRSGATITSTAGTGVITDSTICNMISIVPPSDLFAAASYNGTATVGGFATLTSSGDIVVNHLAPGIDLGSGNSFAATFVFLV